MAGCKIAWIGAGKMGLPVCLRLKAAGHDVRVLARRSDQAAKLRELGFETAASVPDTVRQAEIIFTCVPDDKVLSDVILNDAFRAVLAEQATLIDMSTVSPAISQEIAASLPRSVAYLRSPVSGSTSMAQAGTLTALVSGPRAVFDAMAGIFTAFTKKAFHLGEGEEARFLKLAVNSMVAATSVLLGEALAFGRKGGLTDAAMLEVISQSAVASPLIGYKKDMITSADYQPQATLNMLMKDLDLLLAAGSTPLPVASMVREIYGAAADRGLGEKDFFVLVQEAERARIA